MRSANDRRLARMERAFARRPSTEAQLRSMTDAELMDAIAECHRTIEAFEALEALADLPDERRA